MKRKLFLLFSVTLCLAHAMVDAARSESLVVNDEAAFNKEWEKTLHLLQKMIPEKIALFIKKLNQTKLNPIYIKNLLVLWTLPLKTDSIS